MKYFKLILLVATVAASACRKETDLAPAASLTVINAVVGSNPLATNFSDNYTLQDGYSFALQLYFGSWSTYYQFGAYSGRQPLRLYQYPDTTEKSVPLYQLTLDLAAGKVYSLFLTGTVASPDTVFTTDILPYHPSSDSSVSIRFVNLSPGSNPVSVNISGNSNGSEVSSLLYKGVTAFKNYAAASTISSYQFEVRDAGSGNLLSTYNLDGIDNGTGSRIYERNEYRFKNITLALIGEPGSQQIMLIKNY